MRVISSVFPARAGMSLMVTEGWTDDCCVPFVSGDEPGLLVP